MPECDKHFPYALPAGRGVCCTYSASKRLANGKQQNDAALAQYLATNFESIQCRHYPKLGNQFGKPILGNCARSAAACQSKVFTTMNAIQDGPDNCGLLGDSDVVCCVPTSGAHYDADPVDACPVPSYTAPASLLEVGSTGAPRRNSSPRRSMAPRVTAHQRKCTQQRLAWLTAKAKKGDLRAIQALQAEAAAKSSGPALANLPVQAAAATVKLLSARPSRAKAAQWAKRRVMQP
jgi:hypothetical protein